MVVSTLLSTQVTWKSGLTAAAFSQSEREARPQRVVEASHEPTPELLGDAESLVTLRERLLRYASARDTTVLINASSAFRLVLTPKNDPISHKDHFHIEANPSYSTAISQR